MKSHPRSLSKRTVWAAVLACLVLPALLAACSSSPKEQDAPIVRRPSVGPRGRLEFDSGQLLLKSSEQANVLIQKRVHKAGKAQAAQRIDFDAGIQAEPEAIAYLKDAMRIALSRPDQDGFRAAAFARVNRELVDLNSSQTALRQLADEAIGAIQSEEAATNVKATYVVFLENLMAELKPVIETKPWAKQIIEDVRDARLELSESVMRQQRMGLMARPTSPSTTAEAIVPRAPKP